MSQFTDSVKAVKQNYSRYDQWEQRQADQRAKKLYLAETVNIPQDKLDLVSKKAQAVIRATEIMDRYSEDNCEDMELATGIASIFPLFLAQGVGNIVTRAVVSANSSKLEAKINKLKAGLKTPLGSDVADADTMRAEIKMLQKRLSNIGTKYPLYGAGVNMVVGLALASSLILWGNTKQKDASRIGRFQAKQKDLKDVKNFVVYTDEQEAQAKKAAENLTDVKEKKGLARTFNNLKGVYKDSKAYKNWLKTRDDNILETLKKGSYTEEELANARDDKELIINIVKDINIKAEEYSENVENAYDTLGTISWLLAVPAGFLINSLLKLCRVNAGIRAAVSLVIPAITSVTLSTMGTFAQKEAARVGRYKARKELSAKPATLLAYSDEDMKKAAHIKAPVQKKSVLEKVSQSFKFLSDYMKDSSEYKKYKKTAYSEQEKMQAAYKDITISDKQRDDAEKLQRKVYTAFDEIDEMSQRYSEDIEASTDIAKNIMGQVWGLGSTAVMAFSALALAKGSFPISKIANTVVNIGFKDNSSLRIAVNNFYNTLKSNSRLMKKFHLAILDNELGSFLKSRHSKELLSAFNKLKREFYGVFSNNNGSNLENLKNSSLDRHLKQGIFAKWVRGLLLEGVELYGRNKADLPLGSWKNYKTLIGTGLITGVPVLGVIFAIPYMFNAWLTSIQKKAGKIGIMTAMNKLDDERIFAGK